MEQAAINTKENQDITVTELFGMFKVLCKEDQAVFVRYCINHVFSIDEMIDLMMDRK